MTGDIDLDDEISALLGLVIRQFVHSWYQKISDNDQLTVEISNALGEMVEQLKSRARQADINQLLLDDLPHLIEVHVRGWNLMRDQHQQKLIVDPVTRYTKNAHVGLESEQLFLKLLSKGLVACLLDDTNVKSELARSFCATIINDILLKNALDRLSEPWFIHEIVIKLVDKAKEKRSSKTKQRLLLKDLTFVGGTDEEETPKEYSESHLRPLPSRGLFSAIATLLNLNYTNPLLHFALFFITLPLRAGPVARFASRVFAEVLSLHLFRASFVAVLCQATRQSLFPNDGYMGPPRITPSIEEQAFIKKEAIRSLVDIMPPYCDTLVLGPEPELGAEQILEPFQNKLVNKLLIYHLLDCIILTLVPELATELPQALVEKRTNK